MKKNRIKNLKQVLYFKRWSRASYAIASSIRRVVNIGVLSQNISQRLDKKANLFDVEYYMRNTTLSVEESEEDELIESSLIGLLNSLFPFLQLNTSLVDGQKKSKFTQFIISYSSSFSSFSSKQISLSFLKFNLLLFISFLIGNPLFSQNTDSLSTIERDIEIKEVVIQANRLEFIERKTPKNIEVISQQQIKRAPALSFADLLSYESGLDVRQRGPMGIQADLGINGSNFSQSQLLLNGIKMSDPQTGHHLMNLAVPLQFVKQVEVIKGGAAKRYGQSTVGGAVNIHTEVPEENTLYVDLFGGDYMFYSLGVGASFGEENYRSILSVNHSQTDGYRHNTDFLMSNLFYQGQYKINESEKLDFLLTYSDRAFGANGFYASPEATEQYEEVQTLVGSISYEKRLENWTLKPRVAWRRNDDQYDYIREDPFVYRNNHQSNTYSAELNIMNKNRLGESALGIEYRRENIYGEEIRGGTINMSRLDGKYRDNIGVYGEHQFSFFKERLILNPGFYASWYSDFGEHIFPAVDAAFFIKEQLSLFSSVGKSFRIPDFYDQYYDSPNEKGNPDLKPEKANTLEAGVRYDDRALKVKATYLYRDNNRIIDWVKLDTAHTYWSAANYSDLLTNAFEFSVAYSPKIKLSRKFMLNNASVSYYMLNQIRNAESDMPSMYVLDYLKNQFVAKLNVELFERWQIGVVYRNIERVKESSYQLVDFRTSYQFSKFRFFIDVNNLFNTSYVEILTPMPKRWTKVGVNMKIGL